MSLPNLLWKNPEGTKSLLATPFKTEEEFERTVFRTPEILEDIFLIQRQIRGGSKSFIPDIIGIDNEGNVCIIEMKNTEVDSSIIPQVLQYAFWAEKNPDSIKSLWLECQNKPDDLNVSWDSFGIRIIIIAPKILPSTLDLVEKINYSVDLLEVNRWVEGNNSIYLVTKLEPEKKVSKIKTVSGLQIYDENFYLSNFNKESAAQFLTYTKEIENLVNSHNWALELKFNKGYCGFKAGFFNAFGIMWMGTKTFAFFFKISEKEAKETNVTFTKYDHTWKQVYCYIEPGKTKTKDYLPLFEKAYKKIAAGD